MRNKGKDVKKEFKYFTIFNHHAEEEYLRDMHGKGWRFTGVTGFGTYHFERCEPEDVVYQLDYSGRKRSEKNEYLKLFSDCGWEYINDFVGYSYFRKSASEMKENEGIFSDGDSEKEMLKRVYTRRSMSMVLIFSIQLLPIFVLSLIKGRYLTSAIYGVIIGIYMAFFIACAVNYKRSNNERK